MLKTALRRKLSPKAQALQQVALFSACDHDELEIAASLVDEAQVPAGSVLTREGEAGWEAFVVVSGTAGVERGGRRVASVGPGDMVGEMSLLDRRPRAATVTAETDVEVLVLSQHAFDRLLHETPVARNLLKAMARRLRADLAA